jgi:hypothetical protein
MSTLLHRTQEIVCRKCLQTSNCKMGSYGSLAQTADLGAVSRYFLFANENVFSLCPQKTEIKGLD